MDPAGADRNSRHRLRVLRVRVYFVLGRWMWNVASRNAWSWCICVGDAAQRCSRWCTILKSPSRLLRRRWEHVNIFVIVFEDQVVLLTLCLLNSKFLLRLLVFIAVRYGCRYELISEFLNQIFFLLLCRVFGSSDYWRANDFSDGRSKMS